ncbi:MAG: hypothetical protein VW103_04515 [Halieaceae bacterium]
MLRALPLSAAVALARAATYKVPLDGVCTGSTKSDVLSHYYNHQIDATQCLNQCSSLLKCQAYAVNVNGPGCILYGETFDAVDGYTAKKGRVLHWPWTQGYPVTQGDGSSTAKCHIKIATTTTAVAGAASYATHHPGYYCNQWYTVSIAGGTLLLASGVVWYHRGSIAIRCNDAATFV